MKKVLIMGLLFLGAMANAQPGPNDSKGHQGERHEKMMDLTPQQRAELKTKQMTLHLDLTTSQQEKIQKLNESIEVKMDAFRKECENGKELSQDERFAMKSNWLDEKIHQKQQLKTILTEDQFAKWEKQSKHRKSHDKQMQKRKGQ